MIRSQLEHVMTLRPMLVCWLAFIPAICHSTHGLSPDQEDSESERVVLLEAVSLLRPDGDGLIASDPIDLIIKDGLVHEVGHDLSAKVSSSTYRLRRPGRWLIASPVACLGESGDDSLFYDDLIHAGLLGFGEVIVDATPAYVDLVRRRALLESKAIPTVTSRAESPLPGHVVTFPRFDAMSLSNNDFSCDSELLSASSRRSGDPFRKGSRAHFLLVPEDPRMHEDGLADPDAVLVGGEVILKSERLVRLDEHARFDPTLLGSSDSVDAKVDARRLLYEIVIAGIPRGLLRLEIEHPETGGMRLQLTGVTTSPWSGSSRTSLVWPEGTVTHREVIQRQTFDVSFKDRSGGGTLQIIRNDEALPESPVQLEAGDRYLPETILILLDALWNPTANKTSRLVEVDLFGGPITVLWSPRRPLTSMSPEITSARLGFSSDELLDMAGAQGGRLLWLASSETDDSGIWAALDREKRLVWALFPAPSGITEWRLRPSRP